MTRREFGGVIGLAHRILAAAANRIAPQASPLRARLAHAYRTALHAATAGRGLRAPMNGAEFRIDPRYRLRLPEVYEPEAAAWLAARVRPGDCCVNVGANVGAYALQLARWTGPSGRILAVEPSPAAAAVLRRHLAMNRFGNVDVEVTAVGRAPGRAMLFDPIHGAGLGLLYDRQGWQPPAGDRARAFEVPVVPLDDLCRRWPFTPAWLIVDAEGSEVDVLAGGMQTLGRPGVQPGVLMEIHPRVWDPGARQELEAILRALGRRPVGLTGQADPLAEYGRVILEPGAGPRE